MTTIPITLRPLTYGQILDQAIRLYRHNFFQFVGIIAILQVPVALLQTFFSILASQPSDLGGGVDDLSLLAALGGVGSCGVTILNFILVQGIAQATLSRAVADSYLGHPIDIIGAYQKVKPVIGQIIITMLIGIALSIAAVIWFLIPCVGWISGMGIGSFLWVVITPLASVIIVLEKQTGFSVWQRAWDLSRRRFWPIFGFMIVLSFFAQLIVTGPVLLTIFGLPLAMGVDPLNPSMFQTALQAIASLLLGLIYLPLQTAGTTLAYFDLRIRTEGFDLALKADVLSGKLEENLDPITQQTPPIVHNRMMGGEDFAYFVAISVLAIGAYILVVGFISAMLLGLLAGTGQL